MKVWTLMGKSKSTASDPFAAALRLLTRRDRSEAELRDKLNQFGFSASQVAAAIKKCHDYNYLDDRRFAQERARALMRGGRGIGPKVLLDLRKRGINESLARQTLETVSREFDPRQLLRKKLTSRYPGFNYQSADEKERRRVIGYFQRRGFSLESIFAVLKESPQ